VPPERVTRPLRLTISPFDQGLPISHVTAITPPMIVLA
jgi:hypothetical protein